MSTRSEDEQTAIRYFLGELAESERAELERRILESEETFEQVSIAENELIGEYVRGELSAAERERFEKDYLEAPEGRQKLEFARVLQENLASRAASPKARAGAKKSFPNRRRIALDLALAAAVLVLLLVGSFLGLQNTRYRRESERAAQERAALAQREADLRREVADLKARSDRLAQQLEATQTQRSATPSQTRQAKAVVASFALAATLVRDIRQAQTLGLPRGVEEVRLTLPIREGSDGLYQAILRSVDGAKIWSQGSLQARGGNSGRLVVVSIPAGRLSSDDYILTLSRVSAGGERQDVADYYFRVKKS